MAAVTGQRNPRLVGVVHGDPFDRGTWSGTSHHLFRALQRAGALAGAVSAVPPTWAELAAKAAAVHPRRRRWVERYEFSPVLRRAMSQTARRRVDALGEPYDVTLQVGAWYDLGRRGKLRTSYHDSNLALYMREHDWFEDPRARHVRRTMAAEQRLYDKLDLIMPMSEWLGRSFVDDFGQDPAKVVVVGAGANIPSMPDEPTDRDFSVPRLLFVGFDFERKGGHDVLAAFRRLRARHPEAELWIAGPAPLAAEPGVTWHGRIDRSTPEGDAQMADLHRRATAYVMPSRYEPLGNAFLEAMAWRLPCVGADSCAMPEMIDRGVTGLLVPRRDPEALAGALLDLAADPDRSRAMGRAGYERLVDRFTWDRVARRIVDAVAERTTSS
jgi:glycosyltransferase involved in cell wall biosynthesis